jgi:hypothetical protein
MQVREVAAATTGDQNFLSNAPGALQNGNAPPAIARFDRTHEAGCAAPENYDVKVLFHA